MKTEEQKAFEAMRDLVACYGLGGAIRALSRTVRFCMGRGNDGYLEQIDRDLKAASKHFDERDR